VDFPPCQIFSDWSDESKRSAGIISNFNDLK
jgi:hypothetical protein